MKLAYRLVISILTVLGMGAAVFWLFGLTLQGQVMIDVAYKYLLMAAFLPCVFLISPLKRRKLQWIDGTLAGISFALCLFLFFNGLEIGMIGWTPNPTPWQVAIGGGLCLLVLEGARRSAGLPYLLVCVILGLYPIYAMQMPGILRGQSFDMVNIIGLYAFAGEGFLGLPLRVIGDILVGFLLFAGILLASGAGAFFLDLAYALLGRFRGGPAKVAVLSSGFFGSLSGSAIANVIATGSVTIPAMKKAGYPPHLAGAIEACASTGGILMPPVMGAVAFVMAEFLAIPYASIIMHAAIPALLFYYSLILQTDAHAARAGMAGLPREECPSVWAVLRRGWHFVFVLIFMLWGLLYMRWEEITPFYASGVLLVLSMVTKETRLSWQQFLAIPAEVGRITAVTAGVIFPLAFVVGGLTFTGVSASFAHGLVSIGGANPAIVLVMGAVASYILGMVGSVTPCYIFLAISMAPAVIALGFDAMATHLFILYYGMLAAITPPVAGAAFVAAGIAGCNALRTGFQSMALALVVYFIPFFFIYEPALVLRGPPTDALLAIIPCIAGIPFIVAGVSGYLWLIGKVGILTRPLLVVAGLLLALPGITTDIIGLALAIVVVALLILRKRSQQSSEALGSG